MTYYGGMTVKTMRRFALKHLVIEASLHLLIDASDWPRVNCTGGDSGVEPFLVAHNQLLAHAAAVKL